MHNPRCREDFIAKFRFEIKMLALLALAVLLAVWWTQRHWQNKLTEQAKEKIVFGIQDHALSTLAVLAKEKGIFGDNGLDVVFKFYQGDEQALIGLERKEADIVYTSTTPFTVALGKHPDLRILSSTGYTDRAHVVIASHHEAVKEPRDLSGKRIGTVQASAVHVFLELFLNLEKIKDPQIVFLPQNELIPALENGEVDAIAVKNPPRRFRKHLVESGGVVFAPRFFRLYEILATREDFIKERPEAARLIMKSLVEAENFLYENPEVAKNITLNFFAATNKGKEKAERENISEEWEDYRFILSLGESLFLALDSAMRILYEVEYQKQAPNARYLNIVESEILYEFKPESVTVRE